MGARLLALPLVAATMFFTLVATAQTPSFTDPKTGQVWTPNNVGGGPPPTAPQDRAFNPNAQTVTIGQVFQQNAQVTFVGQVPITAGPTVPLVDIDNVTLSVAGTRWQVVMYLQNNSANTLAPGLPCRFTNAGNVVLESYVQVGPVAGGTRVGLVFFGPPSNIFVDNVSCSVALP
jgi:hypothetical protein